MYLVKKLPSTSVYQCSALAERALDCKFIRSRWLFKTLRKFSCICLQGNAKVWEGVYVR